MVLNNFVFIVGEFLCLTFSLIEPYCSILVPFTAHRVVISLFTLLGISMLPWLLWGYIFYKSCTVLYFRLPQCPLTFLLYILFFLHLRSLYWRISPLCCHHSLYLWCIGINHPLVCIHFLLYKWHSHFS